MADPAPGGVYSPRLGEGKRLTGEQVRAIRKAQGWSQSRLAALLRIKDIRTIQRWEAGIIGVSGPASILLEMLDANELPERFLS